ncbi:MAG: MBL fold metallo-hydrolase [Desulfobacterales bacterium]|jgi:7,8-dihydropterin-6-yl-methyl-4-(beta-D-ribofuranosyl)aminobenzene 5'-phosphate synthase
MSIRISPLWWPVLAVGSPFIVPWLVARNRRFQENRNRATGLNRQRINQAEPIEIPELDFLELKVLVEWKAREGFMRDAGVSYLFKTDLGSMLYDIGFGPTRPAVTHNAAKLDFHMDEVDALTISHLHPDHMGGIPAQRSRQVTVPDEIMSAEIKPCFLPDTAEAKGFKAELVKRPWLLAAGIASTGPLARSLFTLGFTEEQALVARVKDKGLVVFTGCGHPTIEVVLEMVGRLSNEPLYAIGGGLHFPVTGGRGNRAGIQLQTLIGTGKPPWQRITDKDLSRTISNINSSGPKKVYLSGHDTCDHALDRMMKELDAETQILEAGATYHF